MSNTERRLPLAEARHIADDLVKLLAPACERIEIAGSIRRQKPDVGDVELVCLPRLGETQLVASDLFGETTMQKSFNALDARCAQMLDYGELQYRLNKNGAKAWGPDLKWGIFQGFPVDIYSATPETWGVTLAIRTGSAEFSRKLVTPRQHGGFCPSHLHFKGWRVRRRDGEPLDTPEESDVFAALGIERLEPQVRDERAYPMRLVAHSV